MNPHLLLQGTSHGVSREGLKTWTMKQQTLAHGWKRNKTKRKKKQPECVWWNCCIMYVWYHFILLIWIDMIIAKCFLNNWIIYYCLCYLSVSQTWTKKLNSPCFFFPLTFLGGGGLSRGQRTFFLWVPKCCGPRRWRKKKKESVRGFPVCGSHVDGLTNENIIQTIDCI